MYIRNTQNYVNIFFLSGGFNIFPLIICIIYFKKYMLLDFFLIIDNMECILSVSSHKWKMFYTVEFNWILLSRTSARAILAWKKIIQLKNTQFIRKINLGQLYEVDWAKHPYYTESYLKLYKIFNSLKICAFLYS